ncbi:MAG TPA: OmpA family protein [Cyclobacteriaceae bacterium]|nr:OmpA family protein [Cyclobacteriaceae bacterium]
MPFFKFLKVLPLLFLISATALAQTDSAALSTEYYNQGMEVFGFAHRKQAAELFVMATQMNPKNAKAQLMAGESIMLSVQKEQSLNYFRRAWKLDPNVDPDILYFLGQAYHYSEKFDSAIMFYDRYNRILARSLNFDKSKKINEVNRKMFECRNAIIYMEHPVKVTISNLDGKINSEYPDYAPTISEDESLMVFTSRRPGDNANDRVAEDHEYYEEILISEKVNGIWSAARNPGPPLNTGSHNASVNISPDGTEIIIYHDTNGGDLLLAVKNKDGSWGTPKPMEGINTEYLESSATITEDDKTIYFTSNRPGGYGGTDIYSCTLGRGGRWENVKNLGPLVNTELDEEGVFISANGQHLYFSSNGLAGMGDLDIYRSTFDAAKKEWGEPVNLGYPINSVENDIYFVLTRDEKFAYISSLRKDNVGEQDIYKVDMQSWQPVYLDRPEYQEVFAESKVEEKPTVAASVAEAKPTQVDITWLLTDEAGKAVDGSINMNDDDGGQHVDVKKTNVGQYQAVAAVGHRYKISITSPDYITQNMTRRYEGGVAVTEGIALTKMPTPGTVVQNHVVNVGYVMNVYFAHNGVDPISYEGIRNLLIMIKNSATMKVEISGHTDSYGPDEYNQSLSLRRAEAVRNILIKGGADANRITAVGYGETKPMDSNDTMEGRRMNRRIEFRILEP